MGVSKDGYLKRFSNKAYEANELEQYGLKEEDSIKYLDLINTQDKLLVFTSFGKYFFLPVHKIGESKFKDIGRHLNDFANLLPEEEVVSVMGVSDFELPGQLILVTKNGKAKAVKIADFLVSRYSKAYNAMKLSKDDKLIDVKVSNGKKQIIIITNQGKAVRYNEKHISIQGPNASGARAIILKPNNYVTAFALGNNEDVLGLISRRGGIKRIRISNILPAAKTTQGQNLFKELKFNPHLVMDAQIVEASTNILFFTKRKMLKKRFGDVDITSVEEGMSLAGPSQAFGEIILKFSYINAKNDLFQATDNESQEEKFQKAEQVIDQLSLDDLLKDLS